jgi:cytoskeletal protein CcmA (bactofilin family)
MFQKKMQSEASGLSGNPEPTHAYPTQSNPTSGSSPAPSTPDAGGGAATVLAEGSRFVGKAKVTGTIRIEGHAEGEIDAADSVVVGNTGDVKADINARRAVVNGHLKGKISAREGVEFQAGSQVEADVKAKNMVMEDGVSFRGNCEIGS